MKNLLLILSFMTLGSSMNAQFNTDAITRMTSTFSAINGDLGQWRGQEVCVQDTVTDDAGNIIEVIHFEVQENGGYAVFSEKTNIVSGNGFQPFEQSFHYGSYDAGNTMLIRIDSVQTYLWDADLEALVLASKTINTFDGQGQQLTEEINNYLDNQHNLTEYNNVSDEVTISTSEGIDLSTMELIYKDSIYMDLNTDGNPTKMQFFEYDFDQMMYVKSIIGTFEYHSATQISDILFSTPDGEPNYRYHYSYDNLDREIATQTDFYLGTWVTFEKDTTLSFIEPLAMPYAEYRDVYQYDGAVLRLSESHHGTSCLTTGTTNLIDAEAWKGFVDHHRGLVIQCDQALEPVAYRLTDTAGRVILDRAWPAGQTSINVEAPIQHGIYYISLLTADQMGTKSIFVQ